MTDTPTPTIPSAVSKYGPPRQKVPPFARYKGTSAWRKYRGRVREYAKFLAAAERFGQAAPSV